MSKLKIIILISLATITTLLIHPSYSDPISLIPEDWHLDPTDYIIGVVLGELVGWIIGAKVLHILLGGQKRKVYLAMLIAMIVSLVAGNVFWLFLGVR